MHYYLGTILVKADETKEAKDEFAKALSLDENLAEAHLELGILLFKEGQEEEQLDEAFTHFQRALKSKPTLTNARFNLASIERLRGNNEEAKTNLLQCLNENPVNAPTYYELAMIYINQENFEKGIEMLDIFIAMDQTNSEAYYNRGILYEQNKETERAKQVYQKAIELNPYEADAMYNLGMIHYSEKNYEDAEILFIKAKDLKPKDPAVISALAWVWMDQNKKLEEIIELAKQLPENSDEEDTNYPLYLDCLAEAYYKIGNYEEAIKLEKEAIKLDSENTYLQQQLEKFQKAAMK